MRRRRPGNGRIVPVVLAVLLVGPAWLGPGTPDAGHDPWHPKPETTVPGLDSRLAALAAGSIGPDSVPGASETGDTVTVTIRSAPGEAITVEAAAVALGAQDTTSVGDVVIARMPAAALEALARDPATARIGLAPTPIRDVTGAGVAAIGATTWHDQRITGAGAKVAVIDFGFAGAADRLGTELPPGVRVFDRCGDLGPDDSHGTAVAEIVHEVSPHATLYLMCIRDDPEFAIIDLIEAVVVAILEDVDVINHSVGWLTDDARGDGSGLIGGLVELARDHGILWVNSAGNNALAHWGGVFTDGAVTGWNEFATDDQTIQITIPTQQSVTVALRWDDWPTSSNDFDVYLFADPVDLESSTAVAGSAQTQDGSQPPFEFFTFTNPGPGTTFHIAIHDFDTSSSPEMDLFVFGIPGGDLPIQHHVAARSLLEPATSPFAVSVGAFCLTDHATCDGPGGIRSFSSQGPTISGVMKPDLAAPDGVTTSFGGFLGTSAAAPHAAGAAALLRAAHGVCDPADLHALLIGATDDAGPDNTFGHGRLALGDSPAAPPLVVRFAGANRFATAAAISEGDYPCGAGTVFIATGDDFPDALAGAAVASRLNAPVLLVRRDSVPPETAAELTRLDPDDIVILGGEAAVSPAVATALAAFGEVQRVAGNDRYGTAAEVSAFIYQDPSQVTDVFIATGTAFPDALAGGPVADVLGSPMLLVRPDSIPAATLVELGRLQPERIWVLGGPAAVSDAVLADLELIAPPDRIAGADRYATATQASEFGFLQPTFETGNAVVHRVYVAVGTNFPDALAGGAVAGQRMAPILLVRPDSVPAGVADEIVRLSPLQIVILGGEAAVSPAVQATLLGLLG